MNKLFYPALLLAPVACVVSCSEPHEEVEGYMEELAEVIKDHEDETFTELVEAVHDYTQDETSGLVDTLLSLSETERKIVVERAIKSDAFKLLVKRLMQAAVAQAVDNPEIIRTTIEAAGNRISEKKAFEAVADFLPYETQMQIIDIAGDMARIAIAAGLDERAVQKEAESAIMAVVAEYIPVREMIMPTDYQEPNYIPHEQRGYDDYRSHADEYDYNTY